MIREERRATAVGAATSDPVSSPGGVPAASRDVRLFVWAGWVLVAIVALSAWEIGARAGVLNPLFTGRPSDVAKELWSLHNEPGALWRDVSSTVSATLVGFAAGGAGAVVLAFGLSRGRVARRVVEPYLTAVNSLPRVALAPLFLMWFGLGMSAKATLAASLTFFVVYFNTMAGLDSVDSDHVVLARSLGASHRSIFRKIVLPSAVPAIFAGLQLGVVYGMLGTVASEMVSGQAGMGVRLTRQAALFQTSSYFATLIVLAAITTLMSGLLSRCRSYLLRWQGGRANVAVL